MKLTKEILINSFLTGKFASYVLVFFLCFVCISCSSKSDDEKKDKKPLSSTVSKKQKQTSLGEEVKRVQKKNDDLKRPYVKPVDGKKQMTSKSSDAKNKKRQSVKQSGNEGKDKAKVDAIIAEYRSANSAERKIELIESLSELSLEQDPSVIAIAQEALDDPNPEVGRAAIGLVADYNTPEILPVIAKALKANDEQTRLDALSPLAHVNSPQAGELLVQALNDPSEDVRAEALGVADEQEDTIKLSVMKKAISSPHKDVRSTVVSMLESRSDHPAVEILIEGLKDTDASFREEINETLDFLLDKQFETYEEARTWWLENKDNYDEDLSMIDNT